MGGKSYWCDYCECFMKNDINVRKNHNIGTAHNIAKANYLQHFKDPQQILAEEKTKIPCKNITNYLGCSFGYFCRFSHYTPEQLNHLQLIAYKSKCKKDKFTTNKISVLPWDTPKRRKHLPHPTPPSLEPMDFGKITPESFDNQWG